jgi:hypothetical protein
MSLKEAWATKPGKFIIVFIVACVVLTVLNAAAP